MDKKKIPRWSFDGFTTPGLTDVEVYDTWHRLKEYGVLLYPGGQLDQPPEWWADMATCDAIYNTRLQIAYDEKDRQSSNGRRHDHTGIAHRG